MLNLISIIILNIYACNVLQSHFEFEQDYVDSGSPHVVNTAWAMLALLYAGQVWFLHCPPSMINFDGILKVL